MPKATRDELGPVTTAFVGMGGNLGDVLAAFVTTLRAMPARELAVDAVSSAYRTAAVVAPGTSAPAPDYWNAVCRVRTPLSPRLLLAALLDLETRLGRVRRERWASRTLDLDLLTYGDQCIDEPQLIVPHPRIAERLFVLRPLAELAATMPIPPGGSTVGELLACHPDIEAGIYERREHWADGHGLLCPGKTRDV